MLFRLRTLVAVAVLLGAWVASDRVHAGSWVVDAEKSKIAFSGAHTGKAFTGEFHAWSAEISFDPEALDQAKVMVEIEPASAKTGSQLYDEALVGSDWFDVANHPKAVFEADVFKKTGEGAYEASGTLTIKGTSRPLALGFSLQIEGDGAQMTGALSVDRLAYGIGRSSDPIGVVVSKDIMVEVGVVAQRGP